jgi:hypothetical protein
MNLSEKLRFLQVIGPITGDLEKYSNESSSEEGDCLASDSKLKLDFLDSIALFLADDNIVATAIHVSTTHARLYVAQNSDTDTTTLKHHVNDLMNLCKESQSLVVLTDRLNDFMLEVNEKRILLKAKNRLEFLQYFIDHVIVTWNLPEPSPAMKDYKEDGVNFLWRLLTLDQTYGYDVNYTWKGRIIYLMN